MTHRRDAARPPADHDPRPIAQVPMTAAGSVLGGLFEAVAVVRHRKPLHPRGSMSRVRTTASPGCPVQSACPAESRTSGVPAHGSVNSSGGALDDGTSPAVGNPNVGGSAPANSPAQTTIRSNFTGLPDKDKNK